MKPIIILKKSINVYYYIIGIGVFSGIFILAKNIFKQKSIDPHLLKGEELYSLASAKVIFIEVFILLLSFLFFKAIALLRDSLTDLSGGNYFSEKVIKNFKSVGILFIFCGLGELFGKLAASALLTDNFDINFDSSIVLFPIIGIFFMYLSEVFSKAKEIQSENELTV